jgi:hypothetical protein
MFAISATGMTPGHRHSMTLTGLSPKLFQKAEEYRQTMLRGLKDQARGCGGSCGRESWR